MNDEHGDYIMIIFLKQVLLLTNLLCYAFQKQIVIPHFNSFLVGADVCAPIFVTETDAALQAN